MNLLIPNRRASAVSRDVMKRAELNLPRSNRIAPYHPAGDPTTDQLAHRPPCRRAKGG